MSTKIKNGQMRDVRKENMIVKGKFGDAKKMQEVLHEAKIGLWDVEIEEGEKPRMYADTTMRELLGLEEEPSPQECYAIWYQNIEPEYYQTIEQAISEMISQKRAEVQYIWNHPKQGKIYIRCGGVLDSNYKAGICLHGYHQDISDTVMLRKEKEYLEDLNGEIMNSLQNLFYAIHRIDFTKETIKALKITGDTHGNTSGMEEEKPYSAEILLDAKEKFHPEDAGRFIKDFSMKHLLALREKGAERFAGEYRRKYNGKCEWTSITVYFGDKEKREDWAILALQNIQGQKEKEEANRVALENAYAIAKKANKAKNDFLSRMSHDIRTPMNAIIGMTTLAGMHMGEEDKVKEYLEKTAVSSKMLLHLVNEVLDMSKIESGTYQLEPVEFFISKLLEEIVILLNPMIQEKKQTFFVSSTGIKNDRVIGDAAKIQQVLVNILSNANKYTPEGGHIELLAEEIKTTKETYNCYQFSIKDNGIGMSKKFMEHIFEPFSREKDTMINKIPGSGLGMSIVKQIVHMMNGIIELESELGQGTTVTVVLDIQKADAGNANEEAQKELKNSGQPDITALHLEGKRILLAEDNLINQEVAKELIGMTGALVETVENGKEAVDVFLSSLPGYYSGIFMDIQMPIMDGYEASMVIRAFQREDALTVPIIAMTANAFSEDVVRSRRAGMNEHLTKPIDVVRLAGVLEKWMGD